MKSQAEFKHVLNTMFQTAGETFGALVIVESSHYFRQGQQHVPQLFCKKERADLK